MDTTYGWNDAGYQNIRRTISQTLSKHKIEDVVYKTYQYFFCFNKRKVTTLIAAS